MPNTTTMPTLEDIPSSTRGKTIIVVISFLVFAGLCGVGGYAFANWRNMNTQEANNSIMQSSSRGSVTPIVSEASSPTPSVTPTVDPYMGWQTYTDTKYGISFKYPAGWTYKVDPAGCISQNCTAQDAEDVEFDDSKTKQIPGDTNTTRTVPVNSFAYQVDSKSDYPSLAQYISDLNNPSMVPFPKASNLHEVSIDNQEAYNGIFPGTNGVSSNNYVFATNDGHVVEFGQTITVVGDSPVQEDSTILTKVVNTLSF